MKKLLFTLSIITFNAFADDLIEKAILESNLDVLTAEIENRKKMNAPLTPNEQLKYSDLGSEVLLRRRDQLELPLERNTAMKSDNQEIFPWAGLQFLVGFIGSICIPSALFIKLIEPDKNYSFREKSALIAGAVLAEIPCIWLMGRYVKEVEEKKKIREAKYENALKIWQILFDNLTISEEISLIPPVGQDEKKFKRQAFFWVSLRDLDGISQSLRNPEFIDFLQCHADPIANEIIIEMREWENQKKEVVPLTTQDKKFVDRALKYFFSKMNSTEKYTRCIGTQLQQEVHLHIVGQLDRWANLAERSKQSNHNFLKLAVEASLIMFEECCIANAEEYSELIKSMCFFNDALLELMISVAEKNHNAIRAGFKKLGEEGIKVLELLKKENSILFPEDSFFSLHTEARIKNIGYEYKFYSTM